SGRGSGGPSTGGRGGGQFAGKLCDGRVSTGIARRDARGGRQPRIRAGRSVARPDRAASRRAGRAGAADQEAPRPEIVSPWIAVVEWGDASRKRREPSHRDFP